MNDDKPAFLSLLESYINLDEIVPVSFRNHFYASTGRSVVFHALGFDYPAHADLILAGITQLITVVLADKIHHHEYIRSLKPLIA